MSEPKINSNGSTSLSLILQPGDTPSDVARRFLKAKEEVIDLYLKDAPEASPWQQRLARHCLAENLMHAAKLLGEWKYLEPKRNRRSQTKAQEAADIAKEQERAKSRAHILVRSLSQRRLVLAIREELALLDATLISCATGSYYYLGMEDYETAIGIVRDLFQKADERCGENLIRLAARVTAHLETEEDHIPSANHFPSPPPALSAPNRQEPTAEEQRELLTAGIPDDRRSAVMTIPQAAKLMNIPGKAPGRALKRMMLAGVYKYISVTPNRYIFDKKDLGVK